MGGYHGDPTISFPTRYTPTTVQNKAYYVGESGILNSGGGGGGAAGAPVSADAGAGGSGIMVLRYLIDSTEANKIAKATGGDIAYSPTKTIHVFRGSGTFTVNAAESPQAIEYVIVAGGAAAGTIGGGGAGGLSTNIPGIMPGVHANITVASGPAGACTVTVGAGGAAPNLNVRTITTPQSPSQNGVDSSIAGPFGTTIAAAGGGTGGPGPSISSGGSGGGNYASSTVGGHSQWPPASPRHPGTDPIQQGYPGGTGGSPGPQSPGGGGGGAGGAGNAGGPPNSTNSKGGPGVQIPATYRGFVVSFGVNYYVAGGGGGGWGGTSTPGTGFNPHQPTGGAGGGGTGVHRQGGDNWSSGVTNSGGGGGGVWQTGPQGRGGSGIVMIAYPT